MQVNISETKLPNRFSVLHQSALPTQSNPKQSSFQDLAQQELSTVDLAQKACEILGVESVEDFVRYAVSMTATEVIADEYRKSEPDKKSVIVERLTKIQGAYFNELEAKYHDPDFIEEDRENKRGLANAKFMPVFTKLREKTDGYHPNYLIQWALLYNPTLYTANCIREKAREQLNRFDTPYKTLKDAFKGIKNQLAALNKPQVSEPTSVKPKRTAKPKSEATPAKTRTRKVKTDASKETSISS